ncbi:hypothetical protein KP509_19G053000 [Ceratopteris richardii]|uniref:Pentatricopeptide repeat-containing protein n=1 Tax=Ceratopteris richardii TaxID=49495 RepID=A0A8T2SL69_CERRI|nr:hypothetical protein KP509_19G053000 [Ceratopteris richardii]
MCLRCNLLCIIFLLLETMDRVDCSVNRASLEQIGSALCPITLYRLIQESARTRDLAVGRRLSCVTILGGLDSSSNFATSLIHLFAVCGEPAELHQIFWRLPEKNVFAWTALILAYTRLGQYTQALRLPCYMQAAGLEPDGYTFVAILKTCLCISNWTQGRLIHAHVTEVGLNADVHIANALVDMHARAGCVEDSLKIFHGIQKRDITSWNVLISGLFRCGYGLMAIEWFERLQKEKEVEPNVVTWNSIISGCANHGIHEVAFEMFMKMQKAGLVPDQITWNSLLHGFVEHHRGHETLQLFRQMQIEGIGPDSVTFLYLSKACSILSSLAHAKILHLQIIESGIYIPVMAKSSLIDMYAKCGSLNAAMEVFDSGLLKNDLISWNTIISSYLHHGFYEESFYSFEKMLALGVMPRQVTFTLMLKACSASGYMYEGQILHLFIMESSYESDIFVASALIDLHMKCGYLWDARATFDSMPRRGLVTWSALIAGYAWHGYCKEASWLIQEMQHDGLKPTVITWNGLIWGCAYNSLCVDAFYNFQQMLIDEIRPDEATVVGVLSACVDLPGIKYGEVAYVYTVEGGRETDSTIGSAVINMYANAKCLQDALWVFSNLSKEEIQSWNAMIEAFVEHTDFVHEAIQLFQQMRQEGVFPTQNIMASILKGCVSAKMLFRSKVVHVQALELGFNSDKLVGHSLIDVYSKCGTLKDAWNAFHRIQNRDEVTWTAIMEACAEHNDHELVLQCFQGMQTENLVPNEISFLCLLSACNHTGLAEEACHYFSTMSSVYRVVPSVTHHTCMIDLFGRTGCLLVADDLLNTSPSEPTFIGCISMLNHCKNYGNYYVGKDHFDRRYNDSH